MDHSWKSQHGNPAPIPVEHESSAQFATGNRLSPQPVKLALGTFLLIALVLVSMVALTVGNAGLVFGSPPSTMPFQSAFPMGASPFFPNKRQVEGKQASELFLEYLETLVTQRG